MVLDKSHLNLLLAICDAIVPPVDPEFIAPDVHPALSRQEIIQLAQCCPSNLPGFKETVLEMMAKQPASKIKALKAVFALLCHRSTAVLITGSTMLLTEMTLDKRESVLVSWKNSKFTSLNLLFRTFYRIAAMIYVGKNRLVYKAIGHPDHVPDYDQIDFSKFYRFNILDLGSYTTRAELNVDVVIIGSGCGGGVVASHLARLGHNVLVIEKGKYFHQSELKFTEMEGAANLFENGGGITTEDGFIGMVAGSTLGGGSTINWSASFKTPDIVRQQWASYGVPWYTEKVYDDALDFVYKKMGCSTDYIEHSFTCQNLLDGCAKLGYTVEEVAQNTGRQKHSCGKCTYGCTYGIKQGGVVNWLRDAAEHGAQILDLCAVTKIEHHNGIATGISANKLDSGIQLNVRAKKIVVSGGAMQTPPLLLRSGFMNKHIGAGFQAHTLTMTHGDYPNVQVNGYMHSMVTSVCTEFDNLDGKFYGAKLETSNDQPNSLASHTPWKDGKSLRHNMARYNHLSGIMCITRDTATGRVLYRQENPMIPRIEYTLNRTDCDNMRMAIVKAANIHYIQGAERIIPPMSNVPDFESLRPANERSLEDQDYANWVKLVETTPLQPSKANLTSAHQMSSCGMSNKGPKFACTNARGQLYECNNVYIADNSVFPSNCGVNPMVSCMATAQVISGFIQEDLLRANRARL